MALLACALALRFLVPMGWMPVSDARGFHLTLCSGAGPETPAMAMPHAMPGMADHTPGGAHDQAMPDHACPFAGLGLALAEPALPEATLPPVAAPVAIRPQPLAVAIGRGLAAPPPPPTGPPALG